MLILALGILLLLVGLILLENNAFLNYLKKYEPEEWVRVRGGKQGFVVFIDMISLHNWIITKQYMQSHFEKTQVLGEKLFTRARFARQCVMFGAILIFVGMFMALFEVI